MEDASSAYECFDPTQGLKLLTSVTKRCFDMIGALCEDESDAADILCGEWGGNQAFPNYVGEAWLQLIEEQDVQDLTTPAGFGSKEALVELAQQLRRWSARFDDYGLEATAFDTAAKTLETAVRSDAALAASVPKPTTDAFGNKWRTLPTVAARKSSAPDVKKVAKAVNAAREPSTVVDDATPIMVSLTRASGGGLGFTVNDDNRVSRILDTGPAKAGGL